MRIVVSGLIAQYPIGGVTWDYLQYLLGLAALGHDVFYLEDSDQWPYNPVERRGSATGAAYNVEYLARVMAQHGLSERWAYHFLGWSSGEPYPERWYGLAEERRREVVRSADLVVNVSSGIGVPERYRGGPRLVYVDTDPVFTQIRAVQDESFRAHLDAHDAHFTYGEVRSDLVPETGHVWRPLRKPIALSEWRPAAPRREVFTTVMNWTSYGDVTWRGRSYGQKDAEFLRFLELPGRVAPNILELAIGSGLTRRAPRDTLERHGWRLVDPMDVCAGADDYRRYIESSKGEWTVAKNGYVAAQSGWFSGRTACYLAAGRPVVVQDTGFAPVIPVGEGILVFRTLDEAADAVREADRNWARHAKAARAIAEEYFDARKIVQRLLEAA
jgi:glycosyltransferase involved in cell wall biosynthesis